MTKPKVIAIVGPTAAGKTALSIAIARKFKGEVISADSRQIYRGMDIGTGKITVEEMSGVPHHLLDIADPIEVYTAADFKRDATTAILDITKRKHLPIIAGGTFFYLDLLREKISQAPVPPNNELRKKLESFSTNELFEKLSAADSNRAKTIDKNNPRRLIRALEIVETLGKIPPSETNNKSPYDWLIIGTKVEKEVLLKNFAARLEAWLKAGFQNEVEQLLKNGITRERMQEFGFEYTLMIDYIDGSISGDELREKFVQKNWQYAKRQMTWLKKDCEIEWFEPKDYEAVFSRIKAFLHKEDS